MPGTTRKDHAAELRDQIVSAMVELPFITAIHDRRLLLRLIQLEIVDFPDIRESQGTRLHVVEIVLACLRHPGGLRALRNALHTMEPDAASSRRVRQLIERANLLALVPEEAIARIRRILSDLPPLEPPGWRRTFRELDSGNRTEQAISRISLVEAFDLLSRMPGDPVPPALKFVDELSRRVEGAAGADLARWLQARAKHLGVAEELAAAGPVVPMSDQDQSTDADSPGDTAQNTQHEGGETTTHVPGAPRRARRDRAVQARADRLQAQIAQLTHDKADLVNELAGTRAELAALKGKMAELERAPVGAELASLRAKVDELERSHAEAVAARDKALTGLASVRDVQHDVAQPRAEAEAPGPAREPSWVRVMDAAEAAPAVAGAGNRAPSPAFPIVLRGYDRAAVDGFIDAVKRTNIWAPPGDFHIVPRGYDREAVDRYIEHLRQSLGGQG